MDFYLFSKIVMVITLAEPALIAWACWPSSRNLTLIQLLPMTLIASVGGALYFFDMRIQALNGQEPYVGTLLVTLMLGASVHAGAFFLGFKLESPFKFRLERLIERVAAVGTAAPARLIKLVTVLTVVSAALQLYAYWRIGFTPLFAENPLAAKFFSGEYFEAYAPFAPYLRLGFQIYATIAPLLLVCAPKSFWPRVGYVLLVLVSVATVLLSLKRATIGIPIFSFFVALGIYYRNGKYSSIVSSLYILVYALGSASVGIALYFIGATQDIGLDQIFNGAPDVSDLLLFWSGFNSRNIEFSFGRTIYGALVPYHYMWNTANVTKLALGIGQEAATGGLRLPESVNGYLTFGYFGAVIFPMYGGAISGLGMSILRKIILSPNRSFFQFYISYFVLNSIVTITYLCINLSLDLLVTIVFTIIIVFALIGVKSRAQPRHSN